MEERIKCPFCGGEAEIKKEVSYAYYAECRRCEVRTKICYLEDEARRMEQEDTKHGKKGMLRARREMHLR